jgi:hypothetical protein
MATTTTNYGFDIPQSTDLVKDGATAIATLGQDIDTAMNTALGTKKAGMVLLNTTSFSAVAGVEQDFTSADYDFYLVRLKLSASSASAQLNFRYRVANANVTTSTYFYTNITTDTGAGPTRTFGNNVASTVLSTTTGAITQCELTFAKEQSFGRTNGLGSNQEVITAIQNSGVGSPSGVNFFVSSGTMTGKFYAYGYNK